MDYCYDSGHGHIWTTPGNAKWLCEELCRKQIATAITPYPDDTEKPLTYDLITLPSNRTIEEIQEILGRITDASNCPLSYELRDFPPNITKEETQRLLDQIFSE